MYFEFIYKLHQRQQMHNSIHYVF